MCPLISNPPKYVTNNSNLASKAKGNMIWLNSLQIKSKIIPRKRTKNLTLYSPSPGTTGRNLEAEGNGGAVLEGKGRSTSGPLL